LVLLVETIKFFDMIVIKNKRCKRENILKEYPGATIFDVTSKGAMCKLSPFYPHGGIPVPFSDGVMSKSVEGIWQGLKVFAGQGIDYSSFRNDTMKDLKRTVRTNGRCLGHQKGVKSEELLGYIEARKQIYVPSYYWMLENKCAKIVETIAKLSKEKTVVLLDYDTNEDIEDPSKPLSHASLIKAYIEKH
jgi:hypothetical protein